MDSGPKYPRKNTFKGPDGPRRITTADLQHGERPKSPTPEPYRRRQAVREAERRSKISRRLWGVGAEVRFIHQRREWDELAEGNNGRGN